jgi:hypothetical protein
VSCQIRSPPYDSCYGDGDVIVAAGNLFGGGGIMGNNIYLYIGYFVVLALKYMVVPVTVAVFARLIADRLLGPQPERQRKKRSIKNRFN